MKTNRRVKRAARELYHYCLAGGRLDETRARLVADRLAKSPRRGALSVLEGFHRLIRLDRDRHRAIVESATALGDPLRTRISDALGRTYGSALETSFGEDPALIGGVRIKVGSDVYDGSVRGRLAALASRL
jgi:F-type H+-transporting ATPase subunit delta